MLDAQTGIIIGPFHRELQWPPDLSKIAIRYQWNSGYRFGFPMSYPAGTRPGYEEQPWFRDPVQRGRVEELLLPSDIAPYYLRPPEIQPVNP